LLGLALRLFSLVCSTNGAALLFCTGCAVSVAAVDTCEATSQAALVSQPGGRGPSPTVSAGWAGSLPDGQCHMWGASAPRALFLYGFVSARQSASRHLASLRLYKVARSVHCSVRLVPQPARWKHCHVTSVGQYYYQQPRRCLEDSPFSSSPQLANDKNLPISEISVRRCARTVPIRWRIRTGPHPVPRGYLSRPPSQRLSIPATLSEAIYPGHQPRPNGGNRPERFRLCMTSPLWKKGRTFLFLSAPLIFTHGGGLKLFISSHLLRFIRW